MKSYGQNVDEDGIQLARASDAVTYERSLLLYTRRIGTGNILCELLRANRPAVRLVRLTANYRDGDTQVTAVRICTSGLDEKAALAELEKRMLAALARPVAEAAKTTK